MGITAETQPGKWGDLPGGRRTRYPRVLFLRVHQGGVLRMSNVVSCPCGKKLRLQEGAKPKAIRCPGCQQVIRLDGAAKPSSPPPSKPVPPPNDAVATSPAPPHRGEAGWGEAGWGE